MYDKYRPIERIVYKNPTIDISRFPTIDEEKMKLQETRCENIDFRHQNVCYVYFMQFETKRYMDIYYYYETMCAHQLLMKHFIICPGYQMEEDDEKEFIYLMKNERLYFVNIEFREFVEKVNELEPSINLVNYHDAGLMLYHTYFASFNSGIREKMFKAGGLYNIAWNLNDMDGWNIIASNIEQALGISIKMLRKLNESLSVSSMHWLDSMDGRKKVAAIYRKYHPILNTYSKMNEMELFYLDDCIRENKPVNLITLRHLSEFDFYYDSENNTFIQPPEIWRIINEYKHMVGVKSSDELYFLKDGEFHFYEHYKLIKYLELRMDDVDELQKAYVDRCNKYIFSDDKYSIIIPECVDEFLEEARHQHNCLIQYVKPALEGDTDIVFLRNKANTKTPLVTVEICDNAIKQARGRFNAEITPDEEAFLEAFEKNIRSITV